MNQIIEIMQYELMKYTKDLSCHDLNKQAIDP